MGIVKDLRHPQVPLDFIAEKIATGETFYYDHKGMIDFGSLADQGIDITGFPTHEQVAFAMGLDSVEQKQKFIGDEGGPLSMDEVIHVYNFGKIRDRTEVPSLMQAVLNGAEQAGYTDGVLFINYE